jgi:hypothetical protein
MTELHHASFSPISAANIDREFELIREMTLTDPSAIRALLRGQLQLTELSPALQNRLSTVEVQASFVGTVNNAPQSFPLSLPPTSSANVYRNSGLMTLTVDYDLTPTSLDVHTVYTGDNIHIEYQGLQILSISMGAFQIPYDLIVALRPTIDPITQQFFTWGTSKVTDALRNSVLNHKEVSKFDATSFLPSGLAIDVSQGTPDNSAMVLTTAGGEVWVWAVGSATGAWTLTKIKVSDMTGTVIEMGDHNSVVSALATDNAHVYIFMKGGVTLQANSVQKYNAATSAYEAVIGPGNPGITTTGLVDLAISQAGYLYVSYSDVDGTGTGEIRKFDPGTGALLKRWVAADFGATSIRPIQILPVLDTVLVVDGLNVNSTSNLYQLDPVDGVTTIPILIPAPPTRVTFDLSDLWVGSVETLYKINLAGTTLTSLIPAPLPPPATGQTIAEVRSGLGIVWVTFSDDTNPIAVNLTKCFPGLPGVA